MRILVTGGAGFIGSHLCERLLEGGHDVFCLDNLYTGRMVNIEEFLDNPYFEFVHHNVQEPFRLDVDQIYHLACPASPPAYQRNPIDTLKTSFHGTLNVLELAKQLEVPVLLASTSEVYGDPLVHPQAEDYWGNVNPIGIRSCYDEGKRVAEALTTAYRRYHGVDGRIVRIFNTYGPKMDPNDGRVVSNFIVQALNDGELTIYGDGKQTRSFCYIDDLIDGLVRVMAAPEWSGPINLGNPAEFTVVALANRVMYLVGCRRPLVYRELPADDPARRCPDIGLAKRILNWSPQVDLDTGLEQTIAYFRGQVQVKR